MRVKEEEFFGEVDRILGNFESVVTAVRCQKEQLLNPTKIKAKVIEKSAARQEQMDSEINDYFDVN